ncbi:MAG TPA: alpha/beta hydrolase [Microvirga sp.]|jgi:acetyl esterase/lipase|nr:alpha/beta hydrolase [Microvirga sp.]
MSSIPLPEIPEDLRALMAEIGPRWSRDVPGHVRLMVERFTPVLATAPKAGIEVREGIAYGDHPRQAFDVFLPGAGSARPAVLFVHGGAFVDGHRNRSAEIYSNVLYCLARHGIVGVNIGYRLAADAPYPEASRDVGAVVAWVRAHAAELGIDRSRIFLMGHSAGAAHVGTYAYDRRHHPAEGPGLAGVVIVSGRVRADASPENPNARKVEAYYGSDPGPYEDVSPVAHAGPDSPPTFVAWSEFENPLLDVYCAELVYRLAAAKRRAPPSLWLRGHNHTSAIAHLNTADTALERALVDFIRRPT